MESVVYYLYPGGTDGFFVISYLGLAVQGFPLSIISSVNKIIRSGVDVRDFNRNISLIYSFENLLVKQ